MQINKSTIDRDIDLICLSLSRHDSQISSSGLSVSKELAQRNRVFYIEHPYSLKDYFNKGLKKEIQSRTNALLFGKKKYINPTSFPEKLTIVIPLLTLPINFLPEGPLYNALLKINNIIIKRSIKKVIKDFNIKKYVFINFFNPFFLNDPAKQIHPLKSIYYCMDNFAEIGYFQKHGLRMENACIRNFDLTLCTSSQLALLKSAISPKVKLLPNGANTVLFNKAVYETLPKPLELENIHTPIIGLTGSIDFRTDFELLRKIAEKNKDKTLVLVGPVQTDEHIKAGLHKMQNIIFVGPKRHADLPNFLQYFDCAIVPYRKTKTTESIYPLKINEYLAAGLPVVAVNFSKDIQSFQQVAYIEDTQDGFLQAIEKAIMENSKEKVTERMNVAAQNAWSVRIEKFWEILSNQ